MEAAAFRHDRLRAALPRLQQRFEAVVWQERYAAWFAEYEAFKPTYDAVVQELRETYAPLVAKFVDMLTRVEAIDREARKLMDREPDHGRGLGTRNPAVKGLLKVELAARGLPEPLMQPDIYIIDNIKLPAFAPEVGAPRMEWPLHRPPALPPAPYAGDPRLYNGGWHEVLEERARAARECDEREAAELARATAEEIHKIQTAWLRR